MIRHVVMVRPEVGGVAHVARSCAAELRERGTEVTELVGADAGMPALVAARLVWAHRTRIRATDIVHVELGITAVSTFWLAVWVSLIRGGLVTVLHDGPRMVLAPGSGVITTRPGLRDVIAYKICAPILDRPLRKWMAHRTGTWVTLSERSCRALEAAGLGPVVVVRHGADPPTSAAPPSQCDTVVYAGYISPAKGLDVLVDAWEAVGPATGLRLVVVGSYGPGDASYAEALRARLKALDSPVTWAGWVENDNAFNAIIAEAAIVVVPYRQSNPVSGILIRAAVEGRAIIGSTVPAVTDFLVDGVTGSIVEPSDVEGLAQALLDLASDGTARDALGEACSLSAAMRCTWKLQVDQLVAAYEQSSANVPCGALR
jgi:glycosyltransferase involved in cell wall biosynthesis